MKKRKNSKSIPLQVSIPVEKKAPSGEPKVIAYDEGILPQIRTKTELDGVRAKVFMDRYSLKDVDGAPTEFTPEEMWQRVAAGIAQMEKTHALRKLWAQKFYDAMEGFKFVPAGRILSGAGTGYEVTFFNCYVIPSPKDSRAGIMENITHTVEIQARGGGVGINLSSLRPHGARVKKVNGTSSGPVSWAKLYSAANHDVIQQGGSRRGALMLMLHDWHPDVIEFIHAKQDGKSIPGANLSVCISDKFMEAVEKDENWVTKFPDTSDPEYDQEWDGLIETWESLGKKTIEYQTYKARDIWDQICTSAWASAEPGLHFLERSNKWGNTWYFEKLLSTNPCLTGDTWIQTSQGPKQITDLLKQPFMARVNGEDNLSGLDGFFKTGTKSVYILQTKEGYSLKLTADHKVKKVTRRTRYVLESEWVEAGSLEKGDLVMINNHKQNLKWSGKYTFDEGYLLGLLIGDGTLKKDKAVLSVWDTIADSAVAQSGTQGVMSQALLSAQTVPHRVDFKGWLPITSRGEHRLNLGHIKQLAAELDIVLGAKVITDKLQKTSSVFYEGFLRGFFDADGSVQGSQAKGVSVRLSQSNLAQLYSVQSMLLRLGIVSTVYKNRRLDGTSFLPDGKGGIKEYSTKAQHELVISGDNLIRFNQVIGFSDTQKAAKLAILLGEYKRKLNKEYFIAAVDSMSPIGTEEVYDARIPGINSFDANGFVAHNCGEQPLGAWAVCNLGAMNLSAFASSDGSFDYEDLDSKVRVAMRFMDNVVDANYYFWKENEIKAKEIRRTGIGTMGLGDALIKMKLRYGSEKAQPVIEKIYKTIRDASYDTSSDLAKEKGSFPKFDAIKYLQGHFIQSLPVNIKTKIKNQGIRNAVILTQAPTGTTSLLAGVSSGIEPVFDFKFIRKDRIGEHVIYHPLFQKWMEDNPGAEKPDYFAGANDMSPLNHVQVQALIQKYTDSSISKTANAPHEFSVEQVKELYRQAYKLGCKGVTFFRDGSRGGVLYHMDDKQKEESSAFAKASADTQDTVVSRPMILRGRTYKMQTPVGEGFITINRDEKNQPFEVFITVGKGGMHTMADAEAMGRLVSLSLRLARSAGNVDPGIVAQKIAAQLRGIGGASHVGFGKDRVMSLADAIAKALAEDMAINEAGQPNGQVESLPLNLTEGEQSNVNLGADDVVTSQIPLESSKTQQSADLCPECGQASFVFEEGCKKCYSCGYSMC